MSSFEEKIGLLESSGYKFVFDRDIYCNPSARKCFSLEFVEDNPIGRIQGKLKKPKKRHGIEFYFNKPLSKTVRIELQRELVGIFGKSIK